MKAVVLDGGRNGETTGVRERLVSELQARTWEVKPYVLREVELKPCAGCFGCWGKTPGECVIRDAGQEIAREMAQSELLVFLTPVTFGGYSSELKKMVDRIIPIVLPFFQKYRGETHHVLRYPHAHRLFAIGVQATPDPESAAIFGRLVERNAFNFHSPIYRAEVIPAGERPEVLQAKLAEWLSQVAAPAVSQKM